MSKAKILVIDDEKFFRELYEDILKKEGFEVISVEDGHTGLEVVENESFDVVISDMIMPDWDGIRTIKEIKKARPGQEIIIVSHVSAIDTAVEAMKCGASDYILKPIKSEELLYSLRRLIKRQKILNEYSLLVEQNVEYFEILSVYKKCLSLFSINNFDRLVDYLTDVMATETGARKGFFWFSENGIDGDWKIIASTTGEVETIGRSIPSDEDKWKKAIEAGIPFRRTNDGTDLVFVPFMMEGRSLSVIELSEKRGGQKFNDRGLKFVGIIAEFAQTALNNTRKIADLKEISLIDEDSGIYSFRFFMDCLHKQMHTSVRYRRPFSVALLKIDNLKKLEEGFGAKEINDSLVKITEKVSGVIRHSDIFAIKKKGEFYLLFPETDYFGSIMASKRMEQAIAGVRYVSDGTSSSPVDILLVSASYPRDGLKMESLLDALEKRSGELRNNLFLSLDLGDKGYHASVDTLLGKGKPAPESRGEIIDIGTMSAPYIYTEYDDDFYLRIKEMFVDEIVMRPFLRGVLFIGVDTVNPEDELCKKIGAIENLITRIFIIGKKGDKPWSVPNITPVYLKEDEEPVNTILFLNEESGYVLLGAKNEQGNRLFHSSDLYTVEKLISKLRDDYLLQWI